MHQLKYKFRVTTFRNTFQTDGLWVWGMLCIVLRSSSVHPSLWTSGSTTLHDIADPLALVVLSLWQDHMSIVILDFPGKNDKDGKDEGDERPQLSPRKTEVMGEWILIRYEISLFLTMTLINRRHAFEFSNGWS